MQIQYFGRTRNAAIKHSSLVASLLLESVFQEKYTASRSIEFSLNQNQCLETRYSNIILSHQIKVRKPYLSVKLSLVQLREDTSKNRTKHLHGEDNGTKDLLLLTTSFALVLFKLIFDIFLYMEIISTLSYQLYFF